MAIATAGVTPQTNVGVPTPTPTPGSAVTSAAGTVSSPQINQAALAQAIAQAIRSGGPVGPIYQRLSGQPGSIINSLLGGIAPQISTAEAQNVQTGAEVAATGAETALTQSSAEEQAANALAQSGLSGQGLSLQQQLLKAQLGVNPKQQALEAGQFGLGQEESRQSLANLAVQYGLQVPGLESSATAAGAGATAGTTAGLKGAQSAYETFASRVWSR